MLVLTIVDKHMRKLMNNKVGTTMEAMVAEARRTERFMQAMVLVVPLCLPPKQQ